MPPINYKESLDTKIKNLETQCALEKNIMKEQFHLMQVSLKPANLIRNAVNEITESPDLKNNLVNYAVGLGTGYLTKKMVVGSTHNPLKNLLGTLLQFGVTNVVSKKSELIKSAGTGLLKLLLNKKIKQKKLDEEEEKRIDRDRVDEALFMGS